jgi:lipoprotein-releasing system permease protein
LAPAFSWFLALRYLVSRWVTLLGVMGVAVAVWAMIAVIAVFSGFISEIRAGVRTASPELLLTELGHECDFAKLAPVLRAEADIAAFAPRVQIDALIAAYGNHRRAVQSTRPIETSQLGRNFVRVVGIDVAAERETNEFSTWLSRVGEELQVEDRAQPFAVSDARVARARRQAGEDTRRPLLARPDGLILSERRLTRGEPIALGSRIDIISARFVRAANGESTVGPGRHVTALSGAYQSGHRSHDEAVVLADLEFVRRMLGYAADESDIELVTHVAIRAKPGADLTTLAARLTNAVAKVGGGRVLTWEQQNATYLGAVDRERTMMKICTFVIMLVAGFLIYATLHMMVTQKVRDIGVLTAMGATPHGVQTIFLLAGLVIGLVGCALGAASGIASAVYLNTVNDFTRANFGVELFPTDVYALDRIPYQLDASWILQVLACALGLALVVAWLPARRAARMHPVQALAKS